jgi:rhombotail lipoprotein
MATSIGYGLLMKNTKRPHRWFPFVITAACILGLFLAGCTTFGNRKSRTSSSLVNYLFPGKSSPVETPAMPVLSLPLKVGVAWVPEKTHKGNYYGRGAFPEYSRQKLAEQILPYFETNNFVKSIEVIPSAYMREEGGFENLEQLQALFGLDVVVLLSYDQIQFTDEGLLSLVYWTIVGAYVVKAEKNDTQTMLDAAVYDISSRNLLFRAPGTSRIQAGSTPINLSEKLRKDSMEGFTQASTNLVANLQAELDDFKVQLKQRPDEIKIEHRPGYTGGGFLGWLDVSALAALAGFAIWRRGRRS